MPPTSEALFRGAAPVSALLHVAAVVTRNLAESVAHDDKFVSEYYIRKDDPWDDRHDVIMKRCASLKEKLDNNIKALRFTIVLSALRHWREDAAGDIHARAAALQALAHMRNTHISRSFNKWTEAAYQVKRENILMKYAARMKHWHVAMGFEKWKSVMQLSAQISGAELLGRKELVRWLHRLQLAALIFWQKWAKMEKLMIQRTRMLLKDMYQKWLEHFSIVDKQHLAVSTHLALNLLVKWRNWQQESEALRRQSTGQP